MVFDLDEFAISRRLREPEHGTMIKPRMTGQDAVSFAGLEQNSRQCLHSFSLKFNLASVLAWSDVRSHLANLKASRPNSRHRSIGPKPGREKHQMQQPAPANFPLLCGLSLLQSPGCKSSLIT
jgi:hypothetical protein